MAEVKPLRLKSEKASRTEANADYLPYARVLVDVPAIHLDPYLDYSVPASLRDTAVPGSFVEVPYGSNNLVGIILNRGEKPSITGKLKQISKVLGVTAITDSSHIDLCISLAKQYGATPWDFLRAAIPPLSITAQRTFIKEQSNSGQENAAIDSSALSTASALVPEDLRSWLLQDSLIKGVVELPLDNPYWSSVVAIASCRAQLSQVVVVVPDERDIRILESLFQQAGIDAQSMSSALSKSERFHRYLQIWNGVNQISIVTRSGVLTPLHKGAALFVLDDADPSHYERRSPSWNSRSIALARSSEQSVIFLSVAPSYELISMADRGEIAFYRSPKRSPFPITYAHSDEIRNFQSIIAQGLRTGPTLIRTGKAGYITSFSCQKCRNIALCECGGRLHFNSDQTNPRCALCEKEVIDWHCDFCGENRPRILSSGAARMAQEYARSFPKVPVLYSQGDHPLDEVDRNPTLVISTAGVEPYGHFAAIALLDLENSLADTSLRSSEYLRLEVLRLLSTLNGDGRLFLALPADHVFAQEITKRTSLLTARTEIAERSAAHLPPQYRLIIVDSTNVDPFIAASKDLVDSGLLEIIGPLSSKGGVRLILKVHASNTSNSQRVVDRLHEVNRVLSLRKAPLLRYYLDPYDLDLYR